MVTETEKQNWVRQTQLAEKALADAMWRGKHAAPQTPPEIMPILRKSSSEVSDLHSVDNTSYNSLAAGRVIDFNERPKGSTLSSIPDYLKMQLLPQVSTTDQWDLSSSNQSVNSQFKLSTSKSGVWSKASETRCQSKSLFCLMCFSRNHVVFESILFTHSFCFLVSQDADQLSRHSYKCTHESHSWCTFDAYSSH